MFVCNVYTSYDICICINSCSSYTRIPQLKIYRRFTFRYHKRAHTQASNRIINWFKSCFSHSTCHIRYVSLISYVSLLNHAELHWKWILYSNAYVAVSTVTTPYSIVYRASEFAARMFIHNQFRVRKHSQSELDGGVWVWNSVERGNGEAMVDIDIWSEYSFTEREHLNTNGTKKSADVRTLILCWVDRQRKQLCIIMLSLLCFKLDACHSHHIEQMLVFQRKRSSSLPPLSLFHSNVHFLFFRSLCLFVWCARVCWCRLHATRKLISSTSMGLCRLQPPTTPTLKIQQNKNRNGERTKEKVEMEDNILCFRVFVYCIWSV